MSELSPDTRLVVARELLLGVVRERTGLPVEQEANVQEAVEHIDRTRSLLEEGPDGR